MKMLLAFSFVTLGILAPLRAQEAGKQSFEAATTEHVSFQRAGTVKIERSYGYLAVEGWDEPDVEIAVIKSTNRLYNPARRDDKLSQLESVHVVAEHKSPTELVIRTIEPKRHHRSLLPPFASVTRAGVTPDYRIRVPRSTRLYIHHDNGYVCVSDVRGDLDVRSHTGDMIVMLPDPGPYSIDARTRMGTVTSDFDGQGKWLSEFLVGHRLIAVKEDPAARVNLRMGRGSITIKKGPTSGPFWKD